MAGLLFMKLKSICEGFFVGANEVGQVLEVSDSGNKEKVAQNEGFVPL